MIPFIQLVDVALHVHGGVPEPEEVSGLIQRAQNGSKDAASALYRLFAGRIYRYIVRRVPTVADAEDLTAEVFVGMIEGLPNYRDTGAPFEAWLYRMASHRVADYYRANRRVMDDELPEALSDDTTLPEDQVIDAQQLQAMRAALQRLPEEQQTILILRFVERKTHQEAAEILGKSVPAVKSLQFRALSRLADWLGQTKSRHYIRGQSE